MVRRLLVAAVGVGIGFAASVASADLLFQATLNGGQEAPIPSPSPATGFASLVLNDAQTALSMTITINGIDFTTAQTTNPLDNITSAHIHAAPQGVAGGVVWGFIGNPFSNTNPNDGVITPFASGVGATISAVWNAAEGNGTTLSAQSQNLLNGNLYLNFHTPEFPAGAIRGQIIRVPEPTVLALLGLGFAGLAAIRRKRA